LHQEDRATAPAAIDLLERRSNLSENRRDLLEKRLLGQMRSGDKCLPIAPRGKTDRAPLSSAQQRMWFFSELQPGSPVYNVPFALRLKGRLNVPALRAALDAIVLRHEILRSRFVAEGGSPVQVVAPAESMALPQIDLSRERGGRLEASLRRRLTEEFRRPFNLGRDPIVRAMLIRLDEDEHVLTVVIHHIASDLWAWSVFFRELGPLYEGFVTGKPAALPPLAIQFGDYAVWERNWLGSPAVEKQLAYWKERLAGVPALLELPTDFPRPVMMSFRGASARRPLPPRLSEDLKTLSRREGVTLFMTLLAAFKVLLFRTTGQTDIVVGIPAAGRTQEQTEGLIGLFVNTLALRSDLSGDPVFRQLLQQVKAMSLDALQHQDLPFDKLVEELRPARGSGYSPLVQVMFTLQNAMTEGAQLAGLAAKSLAVDTGTARFDLTLVAEQDANRLELMLEYSTDLFEEATARRTLEQFQTLLEAVAANADQPISVLPLLTAAERQRLLAGWNQTRMNFPGEECLHQLFEAQVEARPEADALVAGPERFTYRELNRRANRMADHLRSLGVGPETRVALFLERSADMVTSLLAVLKAGGAYVAMDPAHPAERLAFILRDSQAPLVVTQRRLLSALPPHAGKTVCVDEEEAGADPGLRDRSSAPMGAGERNLAYVIYTSGSTGRPKGVAIEHRSAVAFVRWAETVFSARELNGVLAGTSICFDLSIFEIFVPLACGGKIILADNVLSLPRLPAAGEVRLINTVPSVMAELLRLGGIPKTVETVNLAGEPLSRQLVQQLYALPHIRRVYDLYGPTETTTYSTFTLREPQGKMTIGRPIANTEIYLLDPCLNPVPVGVTGELFIGGAGLARGYLDRPHLTAEKFIRHPFAAEPKARLYRTGDLCRYRPDGNLEYLGRIDEQVKIRGVRIEPGEIESVLRTHPAVGDTLVLAREDTAGERRLVAYVAPKQGMPTAGELRTFLQQALPDSMIPSVFVLLEKLPLNANGKVDRRALAAPGAAASMGDPYVAPRDELEAQLAKTWASVLGADRVGVTDHFFNLGGHSLLAVRLAAQIERVIGQKLPVAAIFLAPSVGQLAVLIREGNKGAARPSLLALQPNGHRPPLFLVHSMGGGILWGYENIARHFGADQPVYAFQPCAPERLDEFDTVEKMAAHYLAEMRRFQPQGPYRLGGYCFGGNVAYEMARQLEVQGEPANLLVLMNAWPANAGHDRIQWTARMAFKFLGNLYYWATRLWQWDPEARRQFFRWKLQTLRKRLARRRRRPAAGEADIDLLVDLSAIPLAERLLWSAQLRALRNYHPLPYGGKVTLLRTKGYPFFSSFDTAHGWREFARGGVAVQIVPGMHETVMVEPHAKALARELKACLDAAHPESACPA